MIRYLKIKNFSVFDETSIEFENGLNIITGETGAGKSVLIDAIKMVLGDRFSKEKQRDLAKKTVLEAVFEDIELSDELNDKYEIEDTLIIRREIDSGGKNKVFINGFTATLNELRNLASNLVDIHGQHDHQLLLNPENHKFFIDKFIDSEFLQNFRQTYEKYKSLKTKLKHLIENRSEIELKKEYLLNQINEIDELNIDIENDLKLEERIKFLSNIEKIRNAINSSLQLLSYSEINVESMLKDVLYHLSSVKDTNENLLETYSKAEEISYLLNDLTVSLENMFDFDTYNPDELNDLIDRKMALDKLCKKYGPTLEDVMAYKEKIKAELEMLSVDDDTITNMQDELNRIFDELKRLDNELYTKRKQVFSKLKKSVEEVLKDLELKDATLDINFIEQSEITAYGSKIPEFLISTNKGFAPAPLNKIASGGELSRVMLALKDIFSDYDGIDTMIFDEVDTGISGKTAKKVGEKLKNLSKKKQLIVITHLPVVAAHGDVHFHINKYTVENKTFASIKRLDDQEKKEVLATMIAGKVSEHSLKQANELLVENG